MSGSVPDSNLIRQYLLGGLDDREELENQVSESILLSDELSELVDSIEDEIIEQYLEGTLSSAEQKAVDEYFLRAPERREKLRFSKLLRHHFETKQNDIAESSSSVPFVTLPEINRHPANARSIFWRSHLRDYAQLAAVVLLCLFGLAYVSGVRKTQSLLQADLARERERSANLAQEVSMLQPPMIALTLVSDRSRAAGALIPHVDIKPLTQRIIVEIALPSAGTGSYDVRLETKGSETPIWTATLLPITSPSGDARLVFDIPATRIGSGVYSFVVSSLPPATGWRKYFDFEIKATK